MSRVSRARHTTTLLVAGLLLTSWASPAPAQDARPGPAPASESDTLTLGKIRRDLQMVRNGPLYARNPARRVNLIRDLLDSGVAAAEDGLREILLDSRIAGSDPLLEQIAVTVLDRGGHGLLDDVLRRVARETGSGRLAESLSGQWRSFAAVPGNVDRVRDLALDEGASPRLREEAVRTLGAFRHPSALRDLHALWTTGSDELRPLARDAFAKILNAPDLTPQRAGELVQQVEELGLAEVLRRELANWPEVEPLRADDWKAQYLELARGLLDPLDVERALARKLLESPSEEIRLSAARAFGRATFESAERRARVVEALLAAVPSAPTEDVSIALVEALLNPSLRTALPDALPSAAQDRVDSWLVNRTRHARALRMVAVEFVAVLGDDRFLPLLHEAYAAEGDGDVELRLAVMDATVAIAPERIDWLVEQLAREHDVELVEHLILALGRAGTTDDEAGRRVVGVLAARVGASDAQDPARVRRVTTAVLANLWSTLREGYDAARTALVAALADPDSQVQEAAANALANVRAGEDHASPVVQSILDALLATLTDADRDLAPEVRLAVTKALLDLSGPTAVERLLPALEDEAVRRPYVAFVVQRALAEGDPSRLLADVDLLVSDDLEEPSASLRTGWAVELLDAAVRGRDTETGVRLWDAAPEQGGRGAVRRRLARLLLQEQELARALALLEDLPGNGQDPEGDLLRAEALRRAGDRQSLTAAFELLRSLRERNREAREARREPPLRPTARVAVELARLWLGLERPRPNLALDALAADVPGEDADDALRREHTRLVEQAQAVRGELLTHFEGLVGRLDESDDEARTELRGDARVPRFLLDCLAEAEDGSVRQRSLVQVGELVVGRSFLDDTTFADPDARAAGLTELRERLAERAREVAATPSR